MTTCLVPIWWNDFDNVTRTAVDEIVRWSSPVMHMRRTVVTDTELGGISLKAGDSFINGIKRMPCSWT